MIIPLLVVVLSGGLIGTVASRIMGNPSLEWGSSFSLGIAGAFVGYVLSFLLGLSARGVIGRIILSVAGACLILYLADTWA